MSHKSSIDSQIDEKLSRLKEAKEERLKIEDRSDIEQSIAQVIWEQFIITISGGAANEFYRQNNNLNLSLKRADHYLSEEGFVNGSLPAHNPNSVKYQTRYADWSSNFVDSSHTQLNNSYRDAFDTNRIQGSASVHQDHTIPVAEILRDHKAAAFLDKQQIVDFANGPDNLAPLDSAANQSKGDRAMREWLDSTRDGKHPDERFNISKKELLKRDTNARKDFKSLKEEGEQLAVQEGNASLRSEITRSALITSSAVLLALLAKLTRDIVHEVYICMKDKNHAKQDLVDCIKKGFDIFIHDTKNNAILAADAGLTTVLAQIYGEVVITIRKVILGFQIGWRTCKDMRAYLKDSKNKDKDDYVRTIEIEKIAVKGIVSIGGIALTEIIRGLISYYCPALAAPVIPLLGSPASVIGILLGGLVAGVLGIYIIRRLDNKLLNAQIRNNTKLQTVLYGEVLVLQSEQYYDSAIELEKTKKDVLTEIERNIKDACNEIADKEKSLDEDRKTPNEDILDNIDDVLDKM